MNKTTLWPFMASITLSIAGSGLMTSWLLMKTLEPIHSQLALSTPIAVVDFGEAVLSLGPNASEQDIESRLLQTNQQIEKLKKPVLSCWMPKRWWVLMIPYLCQ